MKKKAAKRRPAAKKTAKRRASSPAPIDTVAALERARAKVAPKKPAPAKPPRNKERPPAGSIDAIVDAAVEHTKQREAKLVDTAELTARQRRFIREYMVDCNAGAAARRAGYSLNCADQIGYENLRKPQIAAAINELQAEARASLQITAERVLQGYAETAFTTMADFAYVDANGDVRLNFKKANKHQLAAIKELTIETYTEGKGEEAESVKRVRVKLADRERSLKQLGQHLGLWQGDAANDLASAMVGALEKARQRARDRGGRGGGQG